MDMTTTSSVSKNEQTRSKMLAAGSFVLSSVVVVGLFLAAGEAGYENRLFVWTHIGALIASALLAIGGTAILYGEGSRRLGLAGLLGTGFAWIATGAAALWVPIAWQATVFAQTGSSSMSVFTSLFSPMGSAYFVAISFLLGLSVAGLGIGFLGTALAHRVVAGGTGLVGVLTALWMVYALAVPMPRPLAGSAVTIPLFVVLWIAVIALGVSVFLKSRSDTTTDADAGSAVSSDD